jgi:hypothetical protein
LTGEQDPCSDEGVPADKLQLLAPFGSWENRTAKDVVDWLDEHIRAPVVARTLAADVAIAATTGVGNYAVAWAERHELELDEILDAAEALLKLIGDERGHKWRSRD